MKRRIHIGCSMSHSPEHFRIAVGELKELLTKGGFKIIDGPEWEDQCDLYVAIIDHPSTVVGDEMCDMFHANVHSVLVCAEKRTNLPQRLQGKYSIFRYNNLAVDIAAQIVRVQAKI